MSRFLNLLSTDSSLFQTQVVVVVVWSFIHSA